jgi:hypothetical protein
VERIPQQAWLAFVVALAAVAGAVSTWTGFSDPLRIQDDARQFIFWMAEWRDEALFRGDLVAEYWRSVSPWLFTAIYRAFDLIGIEPVTTARLLPLILFPPTALFAFRFARTISSDPRVACLGAVFLLIALIVEDGVVSATPRAFAPLFFLIFLDGLARRSMVEMTLGIFCLAGIYPHLAIIGATALGIALVDFSGRPRINISKADLIFVAAGVLAAVAGVIPFLMESGQFGPTVTPDTARDYASLGPGGRTSLLVADGGVNFICHGRIGIVARCDGYLLLALWLLLAVLAAAPTVMLVRQIRSRGRDGSAIPFAVGAAAVLWFIIATIIAFRLHLPSRFILRAIPFVTVLPYGLLTGEAIRGGLAAAFEGRWRQRAEIAAALIGLAVFFAVVAHESPRHFATWRHPQLAAAIESMPVGTTLAGFVGDVDSIPLFAKRRVLFSRELAVAYQLGYYRQIEARMRDMLEVQWTSERSVLAEKLGRHPVDFYLIEPDQLADRVIDERLEKMLGEFVDEQRAQLGDTPTALSQLAPECRLGTFDGVEVLDAQCLIAAARP